MGYYRGDTQGEKARFLAELMAAGHAVGATRIRVTSGYRSPAHNAAVGGVAHSNHTTGDAMDGYALIKGRWVPLGVALQNVAGRYGLRSGNVPGFYHGGPDPVHVDDGANGGGVAGAGAFHGGGGFNPHIRGRGINSGGGQNDTTAQALQLILGVMTRNKQRTQAAPYTPPAAVQRALPGMSPYG
jgi:hypothetical protein